MESVVLAPSGGTTDDGDDAPDPAGGIIPKPKMDENGDVAAADETPCTGVGRWT